MRRAIEARRDGFTLIELLVVIAIIGLLISLILVASADGVRRAEERATQSLITKLETALNDRLDALLNTQPPINQTHRFLASINSLQTINGVTSYFPVGSSTSNPDDRRAAVIAQFDFIRAELPDVFFLNSATSDGPSTGIATLSTQNNLVTFTGAYPLNFAAAPYPAGSNTLANPYNTSITDGGTWVLPLGNNYVGLPLNQTTGNLTITSNPDGTQIIGTTGMFGASFSAAGGIYKNLGYGPKGYDGVDNNGNGLIDEYAEGITGLSQDAINQIATNLSKHTHKTARSEMLYAILVEGLSPLGSAFSREDFTNREVQDTDGDGLPEFIDAWGEPLQFFRWPIYYGGLPSDPLQPKQFPFGTSDSQLGYRQYVDARQTREQDPLDPNQLLVSPGWWASAANLKTTLSLPQFTFVPPNGNATNQSSPGAIAFMNYFHSLVEPDGASGGTGWDRGGNFLRREFFTKFLILSAGPDHEPGVAQFGKDYAALVDDSSSLPSNPYGVGFPNFPNGLSIEQSARFLIYIENQAAVCDPVPRTTSSSGSFYEMSNPGIGTVSTYLSGTANSDDITNHNISGISTGVR